MARPYRGGSRGRIHPLHDRHVAVRLLQAHRGVSQPGVQVAAVWDVERRGIRGGRHGPAAAGHGREAVAADVFQHARPVRDPAHERLARALQPRRARREKRTLVVSKRNDPNWKTTLVYRRPRPDVLFVEGPFDGHKVRARLRRTEPPEFLLVTRGFHWINERPFNR